MVNMFVCFVNGLFLFGWFGVKVMFVLLFVRMVVYFLGKEW